MYGVIPDATSGEILTIISEKVAHKFLNFKSNDLEHLLNNILERLLKSMRKNSLKKYQIKTSGRIRSEMFEEKKLRNICQNFCSNP